MADNTEFPTNHPLAVKLWSKALMAETIQQTWVEKFVGDSKNSLIYRKTEFQKDKGDKVTFGIRRQLTGSGISGDGILEGNEEGLNTFNDSIILDQLRHATRSAGKMSEQRVPFSVRQEGMEALADWLADRKDTAFFNHACGNVAASDTRYTGSNSVTAIDANHVVADADRTIGDQSLSASANIFNLQLIDQCVVQSKTMRDRGELIIRPLKIDGAEKFVMFMHPTQVRDMRTNTNSGQWLDIQKAMYQGSKSNNPIYNGALGEYNNVILHESARVTQGLSSVDNSSVTNTRRAVFCGAQAFCIGFGEAGKMNGIDYFEELFDYGNQLGIEAGLIWGLKATTFDTTRSYGRIVVPTFASDASTI